MKYFCVNKNPQSYPEDGEQEVHKEGCSTPPLFANRHPLGDFDNCREAVAEARKKYNKVDGCKNCIPDCHTI
ncbi:MAG TPA: hypothetical protein VGO63_00180 [Candidatus Paceibacterota bacterium]|nr:hypothetical protein [Candidatus Paceibacterota bacterium]